MQRRIDRLSTVAAKSFSITKLGLPESRSSVLEEAMRQAGFA
jgi:hypothetical protein